MTGRDALGEGIFPRADEEQWRRLVDRALKGASFDGLISKSYDGARLGPLYARALAPGPRVLRRAPGRWAIVARADLADAAAANAAALQDLEGGAAGLQLVLKGAQGAFGGGLADDRFETLSQVLKDVRLDYGVPVVVDASPRAPRAGEALARFIDSQHIDPSLTRVSLGLDPLGAQALHGFLPAPWGETAKRFAQEVKTAAKAGFRQASAVADARVVHGAGGAEAQELGFALAAALAYLRALVDNGVAAEEARAQIAFRLAADADELLGVAKFRALRRLWARAEESCGLAPQTPLVFAETAWRMMSRVDPWCNLLRATLATFSAAVGGADLMTVLPFTQPLGAPDAFARRLARDTQLVLQDESHIHVVDDPVAGAGGFEALTEDLCRAAWDEMRRIEMEGGLAKSLETGAFQARVAETAARRARNVARGKEQIVGANAFPDIGEARLSVLAPFDPESLAAAPPAGAISSAPLSARRLAEPFEALRDRSDAALKQTGARPRVFLANLGPVAAFTARANFAKNFFEAGGIEAVFGPETESSAEMVAACRESGAKLACLCSSDRIYGDAAAPMALALAGAGARVYVAGRPGDMEEALRKAGVREFIFMGCDMLDALRRAIDEAAPCDA